MTNTKYGQVTPDFLYVKDIKNILNNNANNILDIRENQCKLTDLSAEELSKIIYACEQTALICRATLEEKDVSAMLTKDGTYIQKLNIPDDLKVTEDNLGMYSSGSSYIYDLNKPTWNYEKIFKIQVEKDLIKIQTPLTFKRFSGQENLKYNYILVKYLKEKLLEWQEKNGSLSGYIDAPICIAIIRKSVKFNRSKICDNDNLENGRIVNAICDALFYSDNVANMDLYSCFRKCEKVEEQGTEFWVFSQKNKLNFIQNIYF